MILPLKEAADVWGNMQMQLALDRIRFGIMVKSQPKKPRSAGPAKKNRTKIKAARKQRYLTK